MFIQNKNLANSELVLPGGLVPRGDDEGIFEVPDNIGAVLCETTGWSKTDKPPKKLEEIDPVAALRELRRLRGEGVPPIHQPPPPVTAAPTTPQPPSLVSPAPAPAPTTPAPAAEPMADVPTAEPELESEADSEADDEGPDLTSMTKAQLIDVASEYGIELSAELKKGKVDDLRAYLDKKLYGESEG